MKTWIVILKDGLDVEIKAATRAEALRKARAGKGKVVGSYLTKFKHDRAFQAK